MKNLLLVLGSLLLLSSCRLVKMGNPPEENPKPFVELKGGKKIEVESVKKKEGKVIADGKTYASKSVSSYSDGANTFAYTPRRDFAKLTYTGDINVYKKTNTSFTTYYPTSPATGTMTTSRTYTAFYLQKNNTKELISLNYKNTKKFILPSDPGYGNLKLYKKNRIIGKALLFGGLATFWTGLIVVGNNYSIDGSSPSQLRGQKLGGIAAGVGSGLFLSAPIILGNNRKNLQRAVGMHNGVL